MSCLPGQASARLFGTPVDALANDVKALANRCNCLLAVGEDGLIEALNEPGNQPILATFITATSFHKTLLNHPTTKKVSALFAEANPAKNIALANILLGSKNTAVFYSEGSSYLSSIIDPSRLIKTSKESLSENISRLDRIRAVIAVPDSDIWTKDTFRISVMSLYEQRKVVVGFSKNLVTAGALASLYFEDIDYMNDLNAIVSQVNSGSIKPILMYPTSYQITVNQQVARSLDIFIPDLNELLAAVNKAGAK